MPTVDYGKFAAKRNMIQYSINVAKHSADRSINY